ncbi:MAG: SgcJ/EcaC family oxidoreductase [Acidobacteriota bacterium]
MKKYLLALVVITFAAISLAAQTNMQTNAGSDKLADAKRAIEKGNAQWSEGWLKGDAAMVAAIFSDDGVQLAGSGKIIKGRQQIKERQKSAMAGADPGVKVTVTTTNVWLDGDTAYETGKYKYEYTDKGKPGTDEGKYVTIWKHQKDGSWKLSMDMGVPND